MEAIAREVLSQEALKGEHLEGEHLRIGFHCEFHTSQHESALGALSIAIPEGKPRRDSPVRWQ